MILINGYLTKLKTKLNDGRVRIFYFKILKLKFIDVQKCLAQQYMTQRYITHGFRWLRVSSLILQNYYSKIDVLSFSRTKTVRDM
jgi:hypothetical protein